MIRRRRGGPGIIQPIARPHGVRLYGRPVMIHKDHSLKRRRRGQVSGFSDAALRIEGTPAGATGSVLLIEGTLDDILELRLTLIEVQEIFDA